MNKRLVPGCGSPDSKIAFVAEAPGAEEEKRGIPFVGAAGDLLNRLLIGAGLSRQEVYITNVVKERPPNNDISHFIKFNKSGIPVTTPAYDAYEQLLYEELKGLKANVFVALGRVSMYALARLGKQGDLSKYRGSILRGLSDRKVIPTFHPAAIFRQYLLLYSLKHDLIRIKDESLTPEITYPERELITNPSINQVLSYLEECRLANTVAFDIETLGNEIACISFALSPKRCMCIPFFNPPENIFSPEQERDIWLSISEVLENPQILKIAQNGIFDASFIFNRYGIIATNLEDTMVGHGILFPEMPKGLDYLTSIYTKEPYFKDDGKKWKNPGVSIEAFWLYNAKDSAVTFEVWLQLKEDLIKQGNWQTYRRQMRLIHPLMFMQDRGFKMEADVMSRFSEQVGKHLELVEDELTSLCGRPLNPRSSKQLVEYFYTEKGLKPYVNRKTGRPTTNAEALIRLARKGSKEAAVILEYRKWDKLKGTYLDVTLDKDNRLRASFNPVGTISGRLSSSATIFDTGTNMQNLPQTFRRYMVSDSAYCLYAADLSQAENRVVAYIAPEERMIEAFELGIDIHTQTASYIFGKAAEEISDEKGSASLAGGRFSERFWGKKSNHAFNYGLGYRKFALQCEISESEGRAIRERYFAAYPGVADYHRWVKAFISDSRNGRTLINLHGRRITLLDRWGDDLFKQAYSLIPQSTVADKLNEEGLCYVYENQEVFKHVELLNQIHDSIVFQIPISCGWDYHRACLEALTESFSKPLVWRGREFQIPVDFKVGHSFGCMLDVEALNALEETYEKAKVKHEEEPYPSVDRDSASEVSSEELEDSLSS